MKRAGLRVYSIHLPPPYSARGAEPEALREGFSFGAFLLNVLWALTNRLWIFAGILFLLFIVALAAAELLGLNLAGELVLILAIMIWAGMEGNDRLRAGLAGRGWREAGVIAAESEDAAIRRFADLASLGPVREPSAPSRPEAPQAP
ncbi:MAG TPA: DUF2628 domain-containing protein [Alphaproteobacteria bacterium]|nr:DUF2628 domain-containing protein [Alphaproteobacteria bacterium]